jgi:hypothetical protein
VHQARDLFPALSIEHPCTFYVTPARQTSRVRAKRHRNDRIVVDKVEEFLPTNSIEDPRAIIIAAGRHITPTITYRHRPGAYLPLINQARNFFPARAIEYCRVVWISGGRGKTAVPAERDLRVLLLQRQSPEFPAIGGFEYARSVVLTASRHVSPIITENNRKNHSSMSKA